MGEHDGAPAWIVPRGKSSGDSIAHLARICSPGNTDRARSMFTPGRWGEKWGGCQPADHPKLHISLVESAAP
jgi:hypothetical protein